MCDQQTGREFAMNRVNLADAKAHLSELVAQAELGGPVCITRRGKPVALGFDGTPAQADQPV